MRTGSDSAILIVVAAPKELRAVCSGLGCIHLADPHPPQLWRVCSAGPRVDIVLSGVGKAGAAGATAAALSIRRYSCVLNAGIAGALPGPDALGIGTVVLATRSVFADDGVQTPEGFQPCSEIGFPPFASGDGVDGDPALMAGLVPCADSARPVATVSVCSGTDALAAETARRTGAAAEAMEGAACALAAARFGVPFAELRVISNTTGDRVRQRWDLNGALARLGGVIGRAVAGVSPVPGR